MWWGDDARFLLHSGCWKWYEERVYWQVRTLEGHTSEVISVAFSPDGTRVVSGSADKLVKIWNAETGAEVGSVLGVR